MAASDSRSRNRRNKTVTNETTRQNYQAWEKTGESFIPQLSNMGAPKPGRAMGKAKTIGGQDYSRISDDGQYLYSIKKLGEYQGQRTTYDIAEIVNKTNVTHSSSTNYSPKDQRNPNGESGSKQKNLNTKKKGRSKLRIQAQGDGSSSRLKGGPNSGRMQNKLRIDVQSAGSSAGLNIPR